MRVVLAKNGKAEVVSNFPIPKPVKGQVLIKVFATALNRADCLQRKGNYPPPQGVTEVLGLEISGRICEKPAESKMELGTEVMALVSGGAFAEYCLAEESALMPVPKGYSLEKAAAIPEVWLTAYQLLFQVGKIKSSDTVLIHAGASGVGTAAIQLAKQAGVKSILATTSSGKIDTCQSLGATTFDRNGKWEEEILKNNKSVDLLLDCIGASYAEQNMKVLQMDSRWVLYGLMGGFKSPETLFSQILRKRISLLGSTLRSRTDEYKAELISNFVKSGFLNLLTDGKLNTVIDGIVFEGLDSIQSGLDYMETNRNIGKIVVRVDSSLSKQ